MVSLKRGFLGYKLYFSNGEIGFFIFEIFHKMWLQTLFCDYNLL
jgi:hypothetical protein